MDIIERCRNLFKLIDYVDDRKHIVPLKDMERQPNKCVLKALFYKLKADYLRYIYECLSGDNGLLYGDTEKRNFKEAIDYRKSKEIASDNGSEQLGDADK